jgi:S1-C subfamily serine protease
VSPALVDINVTFGYARASGAGTGIVLTGNGEVLTNNHVINGATSISVTDIGNRKTYRAVVKGYDRAHDVAVIQLQGAARLATATIAPPSAAVVGAGVVAVGNAGGSGGTPSSAGGSITAVNQAITARDDLDGTAEQLTGLLATNAAVQPGDSGGALVVASGAVVGMTTAGSAGFSFRGASGQGFAIVINDALREVRTINSGHGTSTIHVGGTAFLGVRVSSLGAIGGLGSAAPSGATVSSVVAGSAAAGAGIVSGDTITSLGGKSVASASALSQLLVPHHPGDTVVIGYTDAGGRGHSATVTLASGPPA